MTHCPIETKVTSGVGVGLITSLFEQQVLKSSNSVAIEFEGSTWTYDEVNRRANQIAKFLLDRSFEPEDRIGICMDRSATAIISMLGVMKSGCAFVPLDPEFPKDRLAFIVDDASIHMIFCDPNYLHLFDATSDVSPEFINPHDQQLWQSDGEDFSLFVPEDSLAYVMYTSGSTGKPKGVQIEHRSLTTYCLADVDVYQLNSSDRTLQFSTLNFDIAIEEIFPPLLVGSTVVVRPRERAQAQNELSHLIDTYQITALHIATAYWHEWVDLLVASDAPVPKSLRLLIATGEKVSVEHYRRWKRQSLSDVLWCNAYGPTETTVTCTVFIPPDDWDEPQMPIGKPLAGYAAHILNDQFQSVGIGETANLFISGEALARGYLNRPDLTDKAFIEIAVEGLAETTRLYRTGDLARWLPSGDIEFSGRIDHQMKIGSYRIEPGEIEAVMSTCESVSESLILCVEHAGQKMLAAYVVQNGNSLSARALAAFLRERLPIYMVPSRFIFLESFPKTINGKIDRKALPPVESGQVDRDGEFQEAKTDLERDLAAIWSKVLNVSQVGRSDDFFQLGGSSLLVTRVIAQIAGKLKLSIPVRDFFANPTIASLSQHLTWLAKTDDVNGFEDDKSLRKSQSMALRRKLPTIQPLAIDSRKEQLAAVRYPYVAVNGRNHSIVMCNAMGHEATRSIRNLQQLAIRLSQEGFDVVRFDFACTGNSTGDENEATLEQWHADIAAVVDRVRKEQGLGNSNHAVSLLGIRLGATLLTQTPLKGIDTAILWDPVLSGQSYLDGLRSQHRYQLESLTRYLTFRKTEPNQFMGCACSEFMQREIASLQLSEPIRMESKSRWVVTSKDYLDMNRDPIKLSAWRHVSCQDEIYWDEKEYAQAAFSSPHSSRTIASLFANGVV